MLRVFTRSYSELWTSIFSTRRDTLKDPGHPEVVFRHQELVSFCVSFAPVQQHWSRSLVLLLGVKDTVSCRNAINCCLSFIKPLSLEPLSHPFLGTVLLNAALQVLSDGYQKSNHGEATRLIIDIYVTLRPMTTLPFDTLSTLQGMDVNVLKVHLSISFVTILEIRK